MNVIIEWFLHQLLTQWIAIITAFAGFIAWKADHSNLIIEPDSVSKPIAGILLDDGRSIINTDGMQHLTIWLINPSAHDMSFFDLRLAMDDKTIDYYTEAQFTHINNLKDAKPEALISYSKSSDGEADELIGVTLPKSGYGTVPAHDFSQIDLVFPILNFRTDGIILMKLAQSHSLLGRIRHSRKAPKWLRPKIGYTFSETQEFSAVFHAVNSPKSDQHNNL